PGGVGSAYARARAHAHALATPSGRLISRRSTLPRTNLRKPVAARSRTCQRGRSRGFDLTIRSTSLAVNARRVPAAHELETPRLGDHALGLHAPQRVLRDPVPSRPRPPACSPGSTARRTPSTLRRGFGRRERWPGSAEPSRSSRWSPLAL